MSDLMSYEAKLDEGRPVLSVKGEIDISNSDEFLRALLDTFADASGAAVLDLSDVTYLDSSAINAIFTISRRLTIRTAELRLVIPEHSKLQRLVEFTGLHQVSPISTTLEQAVREASEGV